MVNVLRAICQHYSHINFFVLSYIIAGIFMLVLQGFHDAGLFPREVLNAFVWGYLGAVTALLHHFWKETRDKHT